MREKGIKIHWQNNSCKCNCSYTCNGRTTSVNEVDLIEYERPISINTMTNIVIHRKQNKKAHTQESL